jgi:polyketide cyclase/dehydrase/lipid transport protein
MTITDRLSGRAVENRIAIAAPAGTVFDYVTDVRREPEWNPQLREAEKLTPGPVGPGTRYRVRFGRGVGTAVIENTAFDRPRGWSAVSTSRRLEVHFRGLVTEFPGGCQLAVQTELLPHGVWRVLLSAVGGDGDPRPARGGGDVIGRAGPVFLVRGRPRLPVRGGPANMAPRCEGCGRSRSHSPGRVPSARP